MVRRFCCLTMYLLIHMEASFQLLDIWPTFEFCQAHLTHTLAPHGQNGISSIFLYVFVISAL